MSPTVFRAKGYRFFFFSLEEESYERSGKSHFYWPEIDVDLTLEMIQHPGNYPLKFK